jgi:hypothetical protein
MQCTKLLYSTPELSYVLGYYTFSVNASMTLMIIHVLLALCDFHQRMIMVSFVKGRGSTINLTKREYIFTICH